MLPFDSLDKVSEFLIKNKELRNVIIICEPDLIKHISKIDRRKQVTAVIEYPAKIDEEEEQYFS